MTQQLNVPMTATATYLRQSFGSAGPVSFGTGTLIDNDLLRRNGDFDEAVDLGFGMRPGGGSLQGFGDTSSEIRANITFSDGTTLNGVNSLVTTFLNGGGGGEGIYLFDTAALAAVGKTITDITRVNSSTNTDHNLHWTDLGFPGTPITPDAPPPPPPTTTATATFLSQSNLTGPVSFGTGTLIDNDLLRRNGDFGEAVDLGFGMRPGGGSLQGFGDTSDEIRANITFSDGTTLNGVNGLVTTFIIAGGGGGNGHYLFDTAALAAVGKTITDITRINSIANTDHNLNWTDFGFSGTPITPQPPAPPPPPPPVLNVITGTAGNDVLVGTAGADLIRGGDGNDTLTGGAGPDTFVFGADARDGNRDRDVITDFGAGDSIVLEAGAQLEFVEKRGNNLFIQLQGGDSITLLNSGVPIIRTVEGIFEGPSAPPPPAPTLNLVQGTAGNDRLVGTSGDDLIRGGAGNDRLTGGAGEDTFVFGADARNGVRNRDVITDFNAAEDTILFEAGATIRFIEERNGNLFIQLDGDRDSILVRNAGIEIEANFVFTNDLLVG